MSSRESCCLLYAEALAPSLAQGMERTVDLGLKTAAALAQIKVGARVRDSAVHGLSCPYLHASLLHKPAWPQPSSSGSGSSISIMAQYSNLKTRPMSSPPHVAWGKKTLF